MGLNVAQLMDVLSGMPPEAVVLIEADAGLAMIAAAELEHNVDGMPDEVILIQDASGD